MNLTRQRVVAEFLGTFVFAFCGIAGALFAARVLGPVGIAFTFGLALIAGSVALGGRGLPHLNPAVSIGSAAAGRTPWRDVPGLVVIQLAGGSVAGLLVFVVGHGLKGFDAVASGFAANGYDTRSPAGAALWSVALLEVVVSAILAWAFLGAEEGAASPGVAAVVIGLVYVAAYLATYAFTGGSANPARSLASAWFAGSTALGQVWLFVLAPLAGGAVGGLAHRVASEAPAADAVE